MIQNISVLFVCMGNICRSPTAHAVFRKLVESEGFQQQISIDSAGTHAYHVGNPPDERSMKTAAKRGIKMHDLRARKVDFSDLIEFDYILAMDGDNLAILEQMAPADLKPKIKLFMSFAEASPHTYVPDPYYGGAEGFDQVFDMVEQASKGLLDHIKQKYKLV
ncbi:low molecular weight phosphotyrosine protein phosphatase [Thiomicrospira microaerophila]|uniref:low molecular weight protein-tyrosine-phosphatase n=1 Tax=Thiomicrospira microaerophila TaxID=406020 RepID=UPI00200DD098|nr:low molecular weight protein-tyrosine-phosphatase [Thiomicrospira microaerophila]UQB42975.1 low molecular weight phosphotyrosine protein phosphatase [Thiomicrospira microaerophila]